jgi:WD40 repeat protein
MRIVWRFLALAVVPAALAAEPQAQLKLLGTLEGARPPVHSPLAFSPDGKTLAAIDSSGGVQVAVVKLWDVAQRQMITTLRPSKNIWAVAFSPDGKTLALGGGGFDPQRGTTTGEVRLWDVATGKERATFLGRTNLVRSLAFSPDGKTLASGSEDGNVKLWDLSTTKLKTVLSGRRAPFSCVAFNPDGTLLASAAGQLAASGIPLDGEVIVWDVATGDEKASLTGRMAVVSAVGFSPDGKTLATGDVYGNLLLWEVPSGKQRAALQAFNWRVAGDETKGTFALAFSPDGNTLATGTLGGLKFWDVKSGKPVEGLTAPAALVWSVAFSPDGKTVASAGRERAMGPLDPRPGDPTIRLWEFLPAPKGNP